MSGSTLYLAPLCALGLFTAAGRVDAQSLTTIPANARIRVDLPVERQRFHRERAQSVVGTLEEVRSDTLLIVVRPGAAALRVPRTSVSRMYVSGGHPPRWRAALDGALLPALITGALSAAGAAIHHKEGDPSPAEMAVSAAAWAGASGALIGAWSPKERWRALP
jgi:hypothetical protein